MYDIILIGDTHVKCQKHQTYLRFLLSIILIDLLIIKKQSRWSLHPLHEWAGEPILTIRKYILCSWYLKMSDATAFSLLRVTKVTTRTAVTIVF